MEYPVIVFKDEDGVFIARCPVFKGAHTYGMSEAEALQNIKEVLQMCEEEMAKEGPETVIDPHFVEITQVLLA